MSHSTVATAPESSGATAKASREEKHGKRTQEESTSAQETPLKHGRRALNRTMMPPLRSQYRERDTNEQDVMVSFLSGLCMNCTVLD